MAFLVIVPPGDGGRLEQLRSRVSFLREFVACENVLAVAMPPGFDSLGAVLALIRDVGDGDFAVLQYAGMVEGEGQLLSALSAATRVAVAGEA